MEKLAVERTIWIDAPRERVWQAVTEPEEVAQWFLPPMLGAQMKRGENGRVMVVMGEMGVPVATYDGLNPPRQATSRGYPDGQVATTYTLEEENGGTQVTVTMSGFDALPGESGRERLAPSSDGWEKALANLKAYVEGAELPFPEGYVSSLYGYQREKFVVERTVWIKASRERVWQAITDPKQIQQWFSPGTEWGGTRLEEGGRVFVINPETGEEMYVQITEVVDPPNRLVTRTEGEAPNPVYVTDWQLVEENGGTWLILTYSGYEREAAETRQMNMEQNAFGFGMMLENLKAQIEGADLPYPWGF